MNGIVSSERRIKGNKMVLISSINFVSDTEYYVNFDSLTIKELRHFLQSGILFLSYVSIYPILPYIEALFPIWGYFEDVLVYPRPTDLATKVAKLR